MIKGNWVPHPTSLQIVGLAYLAKKRLEKMQAKYIIILNDDKCNMSMLKI